MLKANTLTFDNVYKEAVAEELAAKCSIECNASSTGGKGAVLPVLTRLTVSTGCRPWVGKNTVPTKGQFPAVMLSTARSSATAVVEITMNKNEMCHWCNKTGHIARMCRAKHKSRHNSVAHVSDCDESDDDDTLTLHGVYSTDGDINDVPVCKGINVKVTLGCEIVPMQLDTGAAVSIIPEATHRSVLSKYPLQASNIALKSCTGDAIPLAGKVYIPVTYGKQRFTLPVVVACGERPALLGRDWLQKIKLDWKSPEQRYSQLNGQVCTLVPK